MKRLFLVSFLLQLCAVANADDLTRPIAAVGDLTLLTSSQREWVITFEDGARTNTSDGIEPVAAASWLDDAAVGARESGLGKTAAYLSTAARFLRGDATIEEVEKSWRRTVDEPLLIILHFDGKKIAHLTVCTCDPIRARAVEKSIERFERSLPGFISSWLDTSPTRPMTRIANLHFRAGRGAESALTGSYLPFDRTRTHAVGRTWVVYENMIRANWWGEGVRPIALRILPNAASKVTPEAMVEWYGSRLPLYDAGRQLTAAERGRLGASNDPLSIIKGDLLPVLLASTTEESIATLTAVTFYTLAEVGQGKAPPAHRPASTVEINWLVTRGALRYNAASVTWWIDFDRYRTAVRDLATEILAIEAAGDAKRADTLFATYGTTTPAIDKTIETISGLPRVKLQTVFIR